MKKINSVELKGDDDWRFKDVLKRCSMSIVESICSKIIESIRLYFYEKIE